MENTTDKTSQAGQAGFVPIPNLDKMAAGHADLYEVDASSDAVSAEVVSTDIPLGIKGGKTLIDCEKGIKAFVKDVLAKDKSNHLPNTETGVWVHYLTQGVMRDFNRTWETAPVSIREKQTRVEKSRQQGKRGLSKNEKNELLAKLTYQYYEEDVNNGVITQAEAFARMAEAAAEKKELEDAGYYLSPKKTEGVLLFDCKDEVIGSNGLEDGYKIYSKNFLDVVIPNIFENYFATAPHQRPERLMKEVDKTFLKGRDYRSQEDIMKDDWGVLESSRKEVLDTCKVKSIHVVKIKKSGMMKDRWLCLDCVDKKSDEQVLHIFCGSGHMTMQADAKRK